MAAFGFLEVLFLVLTNGGGNDLLDYVQSKAYWQLKGVAVTVPAITAELGRAKEAAEPAQAQAVRRLMAIRTLGELKDAQALPTLQPLVKSEAPFEAEYAQQAIAAIEGKPFTRPQPPAKELAKDAWLLPASCGIAAQSSMPPGKPVDFEEAFKNAGPMPLDPKEALPEITEALLSVAELTGNFRLHAIALGVAGTIGDDEGFVVAIARGQYDAKAVQAALRLKGEVKSETVQGVEVLQPDRNVAMILPSNDCFVFLAGPRGEKLPIAEVASALKKGTGTLAAESDLGKLIRSVDTSQPLWAVAKVTDTYRQAGPIVAAFDTATLVGRAEKEALKLDLVALGTDAQKVANAVAAFDKLIQEGRAELAKAAQEMPMTKPVADFLASVRIQSDGPKATVTAAFKTASQATMAPFLFLFVARSAPRRGAVEHREGPAPKPDDF